MYWNTYVVISNTFFHYNLALIGYTLADNGVRAPATNYGAATAQSQYGSPASGALGQYGDNDVAASNQDSVQGGSGDPIEDLKNSIPGVPGEDYPILAEVPELTFTCFQDFKFNKTWFQWVWRLFYIESNVQVGKTYL